MDLGRLPSGKFETNELVLELAILSYNILRMIGQESLGKRNPHLKRIVKRRRHRTVINNLVNMACHVTAHARKLIIGLGKSNACAMSSGMCTIPLNILRSNSDDNRISAVRPSVGMGLVN